jgi:tetratricopeptide (TPR) repeat protein
MGRIYARHGDLQNAERLWMRASQLDATQLQCRQDLGQLYQHTNRIEQAVEMCRQLSQLEPQNADYLVNMGVFYARLERYDAAIEAFECANALDPGRPGNYRTLARIYLQTDRDVGQAVAYARTAVQLQPNAAGYFLLGTVRERQGDQEAALAAFRRAAELEPANRRYQSTYRGLQNRMPRRREGE